MPTSSAARIGERPTEAWISFAGAAPATVYLSGLEGEDVFGDPEAD
jgi:hypothetical protein